MKKGNKKVLIVALLLLLISVSFTTYAIYRNKWTGNATVTAAAWSVVLKKGDSTVNNVTFGYSDITWDTLTGYNNTIAPGSTGHIDYTIDADGSEVDVLVSAEVDTTNLTLPDGFSITGVSSPTTIAYSSTAGSMEATLRITIAWTGTDADDDTKDGTDKTAQGSTFVVPVTVTAKQSLAHHS